MLQPPIGVCGPLALGFLLSCSRLRSGQDEAFPRQLRMEPLLGHVCVVRGQFGTHEPTSLVEGRDPR